MADVAAGAAPFGLKKKVWAMNSCKRTTLGLCPLNLLLAFASSNLPQRQSSADSPALLLPPLLRLDSSLLSCTVPLCRLLLL